MTFFCRYLRHKIKIMPILAMDCLAGIHGIFVFMDVFLMNFRNQVKEYYRFDYFWIICKQEDEHVTKDFDFLGGL